VNGSPVSLLAALDDRIDSLEQHGRKIAAIRLKPEHHRALRSALADLGCTGPDYPPSRYFDCPIVLAEHSELVVVPR
jgi:hypothetical protein